MVKGNFFPLDYLLVMPLLPVSFCDPAFCSAVLSYDLGKKKKKHKTILEVERIGVFTESHKDFPTRKNTFFFFGGILVKNS